jgi:hypothetical protein
MNPVEPILSLKIYFRTLENKEKLAIKNDFLATRAFYYISG